MLVFSTLLQKLMSFDVSLNKNIEHLKRNGSLNKALLILRVTSSKLDKKSASGQKKSIQIKTNFISSAPDVLTLCIGITNMHAQFIFYPIIIDIYLCRIYQIIVKIRRQHHSFLLTLKEISQINQYGLNNTLTLKLTENVQHF